MASLFAISSTSKLCCQKNPWIQVWCHSPTQQPSMAPLWQWNKTKTPKHNMENPNLVYTKKSFSFTIVIKATVKESPEKQRYLQYLPSLKWLYLFHLTFTWIDPVLLSVSKHQNHLEYLLEHRSPEPISESLICQASGKAQDFICLTNSQGLLRQWVLGLMWRATGLISQECSFTHLHLGKWYPYFILNCCVFYEVFPSC